MSTSSSPGAARRSSRGAAIELQLVLAGPFLRRTERARVVIWVATSEPVRCSAEVYVLDGDGRARGPKVGGGVAETLQLGRRLFVHLVTATPDDGSFPTDVILGYDIALQRDDESSSAALRLEDLGVLEGPDAIVYQGFRLPSFFVRDRIETLNIIHASCRLLHGKGEDAFSSADEFMQRCAKDMESRPRAMFLTGDQIYADDVAGPLVPHLRQLATELVGPEDETSVPGTPPLSEVPVYGRDELATKHAKFTSQRADNHLMSFGEFAAMYVLAWNQHNWPDRLASPEDALRHAGRDAKARGAKRRKYVKQLRWLERGRAGVPSVRRLLANVPTYMMFDDHDVTDDWNLTESWREDVRRSPTGRRVISNALAGFFAFQGWGNDPDAYDASFKARVAGFLGGSDHDGDAFDTALWTFDAWSFHAPTIPPTVVIDSRTQRSYDSPNGAARLLGRGARDRLVRLARRAGHEPGDTLLLVSPVPVCGLELQERRQKYLARWIEPYEIDFEAWHSNLHGFVDLLHFLIEDLGLRRCLFMSGDIHYGCNAEATLSIEDRELSLVQVVSSGAKHAGPVEKRLLEAVSSLVREAHERVGWDRPPPVDRFPALKKKIMQRAVETDAWADEAPVFLSPKAVQRLAIKERPRYREHRVYVVPSDGKRSLLIGENNVGIVSLTGGDVVHRLLSRGASGTSEHVARMKLFPEDAAPHDEA